MSTSSWSTTHSIGRSNGSRQLPVERLLELPRNCSLKYIPNSLPQFYSTHTVLLHYLLVNATGRVEDHTALRTGWMSPQPAQGLMKVQCIESLVPALKGQDLRSKYKLSCPGRGIEGCIEVWLMPRVGNQKPRQQLSKAVWSGGMYNNTKEIACSFEVHLWHKLRWSFP